MAKKVFCGGLAWETNEVDLLTAMTDFGTVKEAKIIMDRETGKSKGFGFVTFNEEEAAQAAVGAGSIQLDGRSVSIQEAKEQAPRNRRGGGGGGGGRHGSGNRGRDRY
jgi:cold-inducible RNA-binding protein